MSRAARSGRRRGGAPRSAARTLRPADRPRLVLRVSSRNARFQQWQALLGNRTKRQRAGEFLVQGVRPISLAARSGWRGRVLIHDAERPLSQWAQDLLPDARARHVAVAPPLPA